MKLNNSSLIKTTFEQLYKKSFSNNSKRMVNSLVDSTNIKGSTTKQELDHKFEK